MPVDWEQLVAFRKLDCWLLESSQQQSGLTQRVQNKFLILLPLIDAAASEAMHTFLTISCTDSHQAILRVLCTIVFCKS